MLLVMDVGNTNTTLGIFEDKELKAQWRLATNREQTADEYGILIRTLFMLDGVRADLMTGMMVSSGVPPLDIR